MIELLLFDLDNTLLHTSDLEIFRGGAGLNPSPTYAAQLEQSVISVPRRDIYPQEYLLELKKQYRDLKLGIFTRAPRAYVKVLLEMRYPKVKWDAVIAYEDVRGQTKPNPDGIFLAARYVGVTQCDQVVLVGDEVADVRAAYRAGIWAVAETSAWPARKKSENYWVLERVPDAVISGPMELSRFLGAPEEFPALFDQWMQRKGPLPPGVRRRTEVLNHFDGSGDRRDWVPIELLGRRFSANDDLQLRRSWHQATHEIENAKSLQSFPGHWIGAIREALQRHLLDLPGHQYTITVVPVKPGRGRPPRLENLLQQLAQAHSDSPQCRNATLNFIPDLLVYKPGVLSHHTEDLSKVERFVNVRDHLYVNPAYRPVGTVIVLDDVTTTGASLFYAYHYLMDAGAAHVIPISLTKAVSS